MCKEGFFVTIGNPALITALDFGDKMGERQKKIFFVMFIIGLVLFCAHVYQTVYDGRG